MTEYRVHPGIGIARVGNSPDSHFLTPEVAGGLPTEEDGREVERFRDASGRLRRGGCRFRVHAYDGPGDPGRPVRPGEDGVAAIEWTVHLANKKAIWYEFRQKEGESGYAPTHPLRNAAITDPAARRKLIVDPGPRTLAGANRRAAFARGTGDPGYPQTFPPALAPFSIDTLGEMRTDAAGGLLVLGGLGRSGSMAPPPRIRHYSNNDGWFDDTADGPVTAVVVLRSGGRIAAQAAWAVVAPPDYAPQIANTVTLWDAMYDVAVRELGHAPEIFRQGAWNRDYRPSWEREVRPILARSAALHWVTGHGEARQARLPPHAHLYDLEALGNPDPAQERHRRYYFDRIRPAGSPNRVRSEDGLHWLMPLLAGDNPEMSSVLVERCATLTRTQYFLLEQWVAGRFVAGAAARPPGPGAALDRAVLENCVGAAFTPGIEMTWIARDRRIYAAPFRIRPRRLAAGGGLSLDEDLAAGVEPGDLGKRMALPWQADFFECSSQTIDRDTPHQMALAWWPATRPLVVRTAADRFRQVEWARGIPDVTVFLVTPAGLAGMQADGVPAAAVAALRPLAGREFRGDEAFFAAVDALIGREARGRYRRPIYLRSVANEDGALQMVSDWNGLGVVRNLGTAVAPEYLEVERQLPEVGGA